MAYYSGFQSNAFQSPGYQIRHGDSSNSIELLGGGPGKKKHHYAYIPVHAKHKEEEYQRRKIEAERAELRRIESELANAERKKLEAAALAETERLESLAALELAALEALLLEEINVLRMMRAQLMRQIDNDETLLVILMMKRRRLI